MNNLCADCCRLLYRAGITKHSDLATAQTVYLLLMRVFLRDTSMAMFCHRSIQELFQVSKNPFSGLFKSQTVNWSGFHQLVAPRVYQGLGLKRNELSPFVINDTVKILVA